MLPLPVTEGAMNSTKTSVLKVGKVLVMLAFKVMVPVVALSVNFFAVDQVMGSLTVMLPISDPVEPVEMVTLFEFRAV